MSICATIVSGEKKKRGNSKNYYYRQVHARRREMLLIADVRVEVSTLSAIQKWDLMKRKNRNAEEK